MAKERLKFVLEWEARWDQGEGRCNVAALCREFGISRQQGYVWIARYRQAGHDVAAVASRSSRPATSPTKVQESLEHFVVAARKKWPSWGPRKLHAWLVERYPEVQFPAPSTMGEILRRRGFSNTRRKRARPPSAAEMPFAATSKPNATWCVDFKGHFKTGDGRTCYPLTLIDAHTRFLLRCEIVEEPDGRHVQEIFDSAFREFGLPASVRSDNGPPFASTGAGGLTMLAVWWIRLGIRLERIRPGKPQENGRQERFHRTLKAETAAPPKASLRAQQRAFDEFRQAYNEQRPHEALELQTPDSQYVASNRLYPRPLLRFEAFAWEVPVVIDKRGMMLWRKQSLYVSSALAHELVILRTDEMREDHWDVVFGPLSIGVLVDDGVSCAIFKPSRGRMKDTREVSGMSSG